MESILKSSKQEISTKTNAKEFLSGIVTGQIAGLIMAVVVMLVFAVFLGKNPFFPVQVIGSTFLGESALDGTNVVAVVVGVLLHQLGPALLWGSIFGFIATKVQIRESKSALILGLGIGVLSMIGPYFLIPQIMQILHGVDFWNREVPMFWDWAAHMVFGASFILYPMVLKKLN